MREPGKVFEVRGDPAKWSKENFMQIERDEKVVAQIDEILKQNRMVLQMNFDLMKFLSMPITAVYPDEGRLEKDA